MEPQDSEKHNEGSSFRKRSISSILKAPRKSILLHDLEQQEDEVESSKPVEKRNSRRVSFAPANDVLLFANDVKNASPVRNPLQELTAPATRNRAQAEQKAEKSQQISGIENLLKAPLHVPLQASTVYPDVWKEIGEKTVVFSADDAIMDMTRSHTINIGGDADLLGETYMSEKTGEAGLPDLSVNTMTSRSTGLSGVKGSFSATVSSLDPGFEDFLASLSQPSGSSVGSAFPGPPIESSGSGVGLSKAQRVEAVKENQLPGLENSTKKTSEGFGGSPLCHMVDMSVDEFLTEPRVGHSLGGCDKNNPFQCLFPTLDMFAEKGASRQPTRTSDPRDMNSASPLHQNHSVSSAAKGQKTGTLPVGNDFMDMTRSHTVPPSSGFSAKLLTTEPSPKGVQPRDPSLCIREGSWSVNRSAAEPGGVDPEGDVSMEMTEVQTGYIEGLSDSQDPFQFLLSSREEVFPLSRGPDNADPASGPENMKGSSSIQGVETSLETSIKSSQRCQTMFGSNHEEKVLQFTADDDCMDITQSYTANINCKSSLQLFSNVDLKRHEDKTVRFCQTDAAMDQTKSHTVSSGFQQTCLQNIETLPSDGEKTVRFTANDATMDITKSHTVNISSGFQPSYLQKTETLPSDGEKTVRFTANDAAMDVTKSHTVNISSGFQPSYLQKTETLPSNGEKTVRLTANDATMDATKSHTVASGFQQTFLQNIETLPADGEKTVRFTANDAAMDVTKSHTVNIDADLGLIQLQSLGSLPTNLDKTQMYNTKEPEMDLTKGHAINMATYLKVLSQPVLDVFEEEKAIGSTPIYEAGNGMQSCSEVIPATFEQKFNQSKDVSPSKGDKTVRFTLSDAAMDVTQSHTVFIDADVDAIQQQDVDFLPLKEKPDKTTMDLAKDPIAAHSHVLPRLAHSDRAESFRSVLTDEAVNQTKSSTANIFTHLEPVSVPSMDSLLTRGKKTPFSATAMDTTQTLSANTDSNLVIQPDTALPLHACKPELCLEPELHKSTSQKSVPVDNRNPLQTLQPNSCPSDQKPEPFPDKTTANCPQIFEGLDICGAQTCSTEGKSSAELQTQRVFASQDPMVTSESKEMLRSCHTTLSNPPDCVPSTQAELMKEPEPATLGSVGSLEEEIPSVDQHGMLNSRRSRRKSLADLQTKVRRLSHLINADPDVVGMEMCTAPLPQTDYDDYKNASDESASAPPSDMQLQGGSNAEAKTLDLCHQEGQPPVATATADATPFRCKTKQLISRLSVGGFKPKLPRRSCPEDPNRGASAEEPTKSVIGINEPNDPGEISNIYDEELDSCEDMSETIDTRSPERIVEDRSPPQELMVHPPNDDVFAEEHQGQKRPLMEDEGEREIEKRLRASSESELMSEVGEQDVSGTRTATQSSDSSSRCEAAFDSTVKNSLFESQLEDSSSDVLKKLDDGTITVSEFLRLFNIDFVIHNPRQSFLPSRLLSETEVTTMDCLKNRHISRPKQKVYEADIQNLSQEVQRLHVRKWDLQKPLRRVNARLWEEIRRFSEKELKAFGAQLKARSNFYRKQSKVQSHHMKEVLYTNLIGAYREEQQAIREKLEQDDQLIRNLDSCIAEVEAELAKVEEDGSEDKPSLKSLREDGETVTKVLADRKRQIAELEAQKEEDLKEVKKLKEETEALQIHMDMLDTVNEWRLKEMSENAGVYSFLHGTFSLQLIFLDGDGSDSEAAAEQRLKDIVFIFNLDDEKSQDYARLVHTLLSQFVTGESAWVEKYPTRREVPKLLHDVGLPVSRCRLLGEELRLLKMWGAMRLQILSLTCTETRVHVVFSCLKAFRKFGVVFSVSLAGLVYHLKVESFQSFIGNTSIQQIEDIVASFTPSRNLLTKICKKIHETLLS